MHGILKSIRLARKCNIIPYEISEKSNEEHVSNDSKHPPPEGSSESSSSEHSRHSQKSVPVTLPPTPMKESSVPIVPVNLLVGFKSADEEKQKNDFNDKDMSSAGAISFGSKSPIAAHNNVIDNSKQPHIEITSKVDPVVPPKIAIPPADSVPVVGAILTPSGIVNIHPKVNLPPVPPSADSSWENVGSTPPPHGCCIIS